MSDMPNPTEINVVHDMRVEDTAGDDKSSVGCPKCARTFISDHAVTVHDAMTHKPLAIVQDRRVIEEKMISLLQGLVDDIGPSDIRNASFREKMTAIGILHDKLFRLQGATQAAVQINIKATNIEHPDAILDIRST